jgi:hypothetical protein
MMIAPRLFPMLWAEMIVALCLSRTVIAWARVVVCSCRFVPRGMVAHSEYQSRACQGLIVSELCDLGHAKEEHQALTSLLRTRLRDVCGVDGRLYIPTIHAGAAIAYHGAAHGDKKGRWGTRHGLAIHQLPCGGVMSVISVG